MGHMSAGPRRMIATVAAAAALTVPTDSQSRTINHGAIFTSTGDTFQFSYPDNFKVCTAGKMKPCRLTSYTPPCNEDAIVCVLYPEREFEGTNVGSAGFQVREIRAQGEVMTPDVCVTPNENEFLISARHPEEVIGGVLFVHGIVSEAAAGNSAWGDVYRTFHRQKCYELRLGESESDPKNYDPPIRTLTQAQHKDVTDSLSRILHSFKFLK